MDRIKQARYALLSLTVYRGILGNSVVKAFAKLLEAAAGVTLRAFLEAYGEFIRLLAARSSRLDFAQVLNACIRYDDNPFARQAAGGGTCIELRDAALADMTALGAVYGLDGNTVKAYAVTQFNDDDLSPVGGLPSFSNSEADVSPESRLAGLEAFYAANGFGRFARYGAFRWRGAIGRRGGAACDGLLGVENPDTVTLRSLKGYEYERNLVVSNTIDFIEGRPFNNMLLYGDRGTGKSSTVKAVFNEFKSRGLRMIEISKDCIADFPHIVEAVEGLPLKFILFIDDLSFSEDDDSYTALKAVLEGGLAARPQNCVIYATSNRRHLVKERFSDREGDDLHAADSMQEKLSLSDRFGITVTFSAPDQQLYFDIVNEMAKDRRLSVAKPLLELGAARWALRFNGRSPRTARHYIDWVESRLKTGQDITDI